MDTRRRDAYEKSKKRFKTHKPRYGKDRIHASRTDRVNIINKKTLRAHAAETMKIIADRGFANCDISAELRHMCENTKCVTGIFDAPDAHNNTVISTVRGTTLGVCLALREEYKEILALNFASARNPGGGFMKGANAQEESLCRSSALYNGLIGQPMYTEDINEGLYTNCSIYTPDVPVFRNDDGDLIPPTNISFISCAAVNAKAAYRKGLPKNIIRTAMYNRIDHMLGVAAKYMPHVLVLGAWGCGVFGNDSNFIASSFSHLLKNKYYNVFEKIIFVAHDKPNYLIFESIS